MGISLELLTITAHSVNTRQPHHHVSLSDGIMSARLDPVTDSGVTGLLASRLTDRMDGWVGRWMNE